MWVSLIGWRARGFILVAMLVGLLVAVASARAAVIQLNTTADEIAPGDGLCSLREAIADVNSPAPLSDCGPVGGGANTIELGAGGHRLAIPATSPDSNASGDLDVAGTVSNLTIEGVGTGPTAASASEIVASGNGDRVLQVAAGATVTVRDLVVTGGRIGPGAPGDPTSPTGTLNGGPGAGGGGIDNAGALTLSNVIVVDNRAGDGGAAAAMMPNAGRGGDGGNGGGILNSGALSLIGSTIEGNVAGGGGTGGVLPPGNAGPGGAGGDGGGIANGGTLTISATTIAHNFAGAGGAGGTGDSAGAGGPGGSGGGVFTGLFGTLAATDTTISDNIAGSGGDGACGCFNLGGRGGNGGSGGGLEVAVAGASLSNVTVADNARGVGGQGGADFGGRGPDGAAGAGGGIASGAVACGGGCTRLENSIVADNGGGNCTGALTGAGLHDLVFGDSTCPGTVADPKLGPLAGNGASTQTMALGAGSAAIDIVPTGPTCPPADQRGVARPQGKACDAGAYELAPPRIANAGAIATSPTGAVVVASVNANLKNTTVLVRYGPTVAYGSTGAGIGVGAGDQPVPVSIPLSGLTPGATYHAQLVASNPDGTTRSVDLSVTTTAARGGAGSAGSAGGGGAGSGGSAGGGGGPPTPPTLSHVRQSARRWREGNRLASISARRRLPVGTTFSLAVNEPATVTFKFTQTVHGRRVKGRCVALTRRNARGRRCRATIVRGRLSFSAHRGVNRIRFQGLLARGRRLKPGTYMVAITAAIAGARPSAPSKLTFTIVGRGR